MTKKVNNCYFHTHHKIPNWFSGFGDLGRPIPVPHHSTFQILDGKTNVVLTGVPDEIFQNGDGSLFIPDYKTGRFTGNQDKLLPMYAMQLNTYSLIATRIGMGKVSGIGLVYFEPLTEVDASTIDSIILDNGFSMKFTAKLLPLRLEPKKISPLLRKVRAIHDQPDPPDGRPGCKDCQLLDGLMETVANKKGRR